MFIPLGDALVQASDQATRNFAAGGVEYVGIPTGIRTLDVMTGGLRKKDLILYGGRTGLGKSALALTTAMKQCTMGYNVGYVSLEMSSLVLSYRFLAAKANLDAMKIERGRISPEEITIVQNEAASMKKFNFFIDDTSHSTETLKQVVEFQKPTIEVLYVDYLGLLTDKGNENEATRIANISRNLKVLATDLDIPVVALVQLNRETEKTEGAQPSIVHIRGSGGPEMDASGIIMVHRPHHYAMMSGKSQKVKCESDAELHVVKNRYGPMGKILMNFYPEQMKWEDQNGG